MFRLDNKIAIVTGGASGIGKAIALLLARQGADTIIFDLDDTAAADTLRESRESKVNLDYRRCNVSDQAGVKKIVGEIISQKGGIDLLVNNAGIAHVGNVENTEEKDFDRLFNVNARGIYNCLHAVIPFMKERGGAIVNMASVVATVGIPDRFAYSMTKGAVIGMTLSVAKDYVAHKIRCNSISPGRVHTPFVDGFIAKNYPGKEKEMFEKLSKTQPIGRMAKPEEIASLALYLCSDEASFVTGSDYHIDGGFVTLNN
jgi:NAD(P)-dependent dehydrogenase (short-subunit alcohol dehydrogenase family)